MKKKSAILFLLALIMVCLLPLKSKAAAVTYYQTNKANVPIWSQASSSSTKRRTIASANTVLKITGSTKNSSGNLWYQLSDGTWVFSGNVTKHSHSYSGGICTNSTCRYEYPYSVSSYYATVEVKNTSGAKIWSRPYSNNSAHYRTEAYTKLLSVVAKTTNQEGHIWYRLSDGCWVYSDNVKTHYHSYSGGICSNGYCRYEYPYSVSSYYATVEVKNTSGAKIWSRPYSNNSTHYRTEAYQKVFSVIAKTTNQENHVWYKLSDGSWVYSDNVKTHSHSYKGGICSNGYCKYEYPYSVSSYSATVEVTNKNGAKIMSRPYSSNSTLKRTDALGKVFKVTSKTTNQEGNVWYKLSDGNWVFSDNVKKHSHTYKGGMCTNTSCKYEYPYTVSSYSATVEVTNKSGAKIMSRPYSSNSTLKRTDALGKVFKVTSKTTNQEGNVWYKLSDGNWVFSGNVKKHSHTYKGGMCTNNTCKHEYPYTVTAHSETRYVINKDGAKIWSRPYSNNSTHKRTEAYGKALAITAKTTNQDGHLWYKLSDGSWVFSENTGKRYSVKYNAKGGSGAPGTQYVLEGATLKLTTAKPVRVGYTFSGWSTSSDAKSVTHTPGKTYTFKKNTTLYAVWKTCKHTYKGGICSGCSYEYPLSIKSLSATFVVTNDEGAIIRNRPYSQNAKTIRTEKYQRALTVKAYTNNQEGNRWYQLSDGNWVYSGNVTRRYTVSYNANGGKGTPDSQTFLSGKTLTLSKTAPKKTGYIFKGWATSKSATKAEYKSGGSYSTKKDLKLYAVWAKCSHKAYTGGYCNSCNYEYKITETALSGTFVVTNSKGAPIWSRPYSDKSVKKRTDKAGKALTVVAKTTNQEGNVWYKLSDGYWVYSKNVKQQYTVKYDANGGTSAPKAQTFLAGETLKITSSKPKMSGYIFQGWAKSDSSTTVAYASGATYKASSSKPSVTLYAVWSKCTHKYSYGICSSCKYSWPYEEKNLVDSVYEVNNSDGVYSYKRPYSKSSEKVTKYKKDAPVVVAAKATNYNGAEWYKLRDGTWIKASELTAKTTFYTMDKITTSAYNTLAKGKISAHNINGKWFYLFTNGSSKVYLAISAFGGSCDNSAALSSVSSYLTSAVNKHASSKPRSFIFNKFEKYTATGVAPDKSDSYIGYKWSVYKLTASAGTDTEDTINTNCEYNSGLCLNYHSKIKVLQGGKTSFKAPSTAAEYVQALNRSKISKGVITPEFTVSVTKSPAEYNPQTGEYFFTGHFGSYQMSGKGYAKKELNLLNYVTMFTTAKKLVDAAIAFTNPEVALAKALYSALTDGWSFYTKSSDYTSSASYQSESSPLTIYDENTVYRVYKIKVKSPIRLQCSGDYIKTYYNLYKLSPDQTFDIKLEIK